MGRTHTAAVRQNLDCYTTMYLIGAGGRKDVIEKECHSPSDRLLSTKIHDADRRS